MNRTTRTLLVAVAVLAALVTSAPGAVALSAEPTPDDDGDGTKLCKRVIGLNTCVAVNYGDCTLWVSAGLGGCFYIG